TSRPVRPMLYPARRSSPSARSSAATTSRRELCPHIIGRNRSGEEVVLAWQFAGGSSGRLAQRRWLRLAHVSDAQSREGPWHEGGSHRSEQTCVSDIDLDINIHVRKRRWRDAYFSIHSGWRVGICAVSLTEESTITVSVRSTPGTALITLASRPSSMRVF